MSGGGGGSLGLGKSSGKQKDPAASTLAALATQFAKETSGIRRGIIEQFNQILTNPTGAKSTVPVIAQAAEQSRQAASQAQQETTEELARTGLVGTPFGQNILAQGQREGNFGVSNVTTDIMKQIFGMIPSFVLGQSGNAMQGLSGAVGGNVSGKGKNTKFGMGGGK